jgi:hypothetical protein
VNTFKARGCPSPYVDAFAAPHNALVPRHWSQMTPLNTPGWGSCPPKPTPL